MNKIEHIGIAVSDLKAAGSLYEKLLNTTVYKIEDVVSEGVKTAFLQSGPNKIELLEASSADSPMGKFITKKGEGIHHIAFEVDDIKAEMARLKNEGFVLLSDEPKPGADNKLVCFVHPKSAGGVLVELVQDAGNSVLEKYNIGFFRKFVLNEDFDSMASSSPILDQFVTNYHSANEVEQYLLGYIENVLNRSSAIEILISDSQVTLELSYDISKFYWNPDLVGDVPNFIINTIELKQIVIAWAEYLKMN